MHKILRIAAAMAIVVACPSTAAAQSTPEWTDQVRSGKSIFVMTTDGVQIDGKAGPAVLEGLIVYTPAGRRMIPYDRVFRVEKRDSLASGSLYGAIGGYIFGWVTATHDCDGGIWTFCDPGFTQVVALMGAGIGTLIGGAIDAAEGGRSTVYEAPPPARVSLRVGAGRGAIAITW